MVQHRTGKSKKMPQTFELNISHPDKDPFRQEQQKILKVVDSLMPNGTKKIESKSTGVDYNYVGMKIDRKFGFGKENTDSIIIRTNKGQLVNESDYILVMHKNRIEMFPTSVLKNFIEKHSKRIIQDSSLRTKRTKAGEIHQQARIKLSEFYRITKTNPATISIPLERIAKNQARLKRVELGKIQTLMEKGLQRLQLLNRVKAVKTNLFFTQSRQSLAKKARIQKKQTTSKTNPKVVRRIRRR